MGGAAEPAHERFRWAPPSRSQRTRAVAAALVAGLLAVLLVANDDDLSATKRERAQGAASIPVAKPVAASVEQLRTLADSVGYPIYWAGAKLGQTYELTRMADGRVFIRYLPSGVEVGDPRLDFSFVATYPDSNAFGRIRRAARRKRASKRTVARGGLAVTNEGGELVRSTGRPLPTPPVFFARPRSKVLVEVYDPVAFGRALRSVASGQVRPIR